MISVMKSNFWADMILWHSERYGLGTSMAGEILCVVNSAKTTHTKTPDETTRCDDERPTVAVDEEPTLAPSIGMIEMICVV